ncbi:MAG: AraC family transcriptional regulator [Actinomycetota bacterium]
MATPESLVQLDSVTAAVARHAPVDGTHDTPLDGVRLFRVSAPVDRVPGVYDPSVCVVVSGAKHAHHAGRTHVYGPGRYLCTTMPTPVEAEIPRATPDEPVLGVLIDLEARPMAELMVQYRAVSSRALAPTLADRRAGPPAALTVVPWGETFWSALVRVLELLDEPRALDLLGHGRLRELHYALVEGPAGVEIRAALSAPTHEFGSVLTYMRANLDHPLAVEDLAARAGMSRAAFDRHFKATTGLSPLRYLKALRLNDAAMLIAGGTDIGVAAAKVGYRNPSQFTREFKRHFGATPRTWVSTAGHGDPQLLAVS